MRKALSGTILWIIMMVCGICFLLPGCSSPDEQKEGAALPQFEDNNIPVLYLNIDPEEFVKVNESPDHSYRAQDGTVKICVPEGYTGDYGTEVLENTQELELDYIRGRGNGTWSSEKRPYRFKLKEKEDLLGMGANKHWVLLANSFDPTLLRNRLISYISTQMGLSFTPKCLPVDLVVNGQYYGSYLLCENVRVGKNRVNIDELSEEDIAEPEVTGGYLMHFFPKGDESLENVLVTDRMVRFGIDSPDFSEGESGQKEQQTYIFDYLQKTEDAIFSQDFCDEEGVPYSEYMDIDSAARYWWIQEYSVNFDGMKTSSTYLYKERSGKLCWGPVWDFDLALGRSDDTIDGFLNCPMIWLDRLRAFEPGYQQALTETWEELDKILDSVIEEGGVLDIYADQIRSSWEDDCLLMNGYPEDGTVPDDFDREIEHLRSWMRARKDWINNNIEKELFYVYDTATLMADGQTVGNVSVRHGSWLDPIPAGPVKEGFVFVGWEKEDHTMYEDMDRLDGDIVLNAVYIPIEEAVLADGIYFNDYDLWLDIHQKQDRCSYTLIPEDASERLVIWTSSDPGVVRVDEYGKLTLISTGEAMITGTLRSGASSSFKLHVYDSLQTPVLDPEQIDLMTESLVLKVGEYSQAAAELLPKPNGSALVYSSDDESVAAVDYNGVIWAAEPGTTTIHIEAAGAEGISADMTVTVESAD